MARPKIKVYLAGPVTGTSDWKERFAQYAEILKCTGYAVFNPAAVAQALPIPHMKDADFYRIGLAVLEACEVIALMPGWEKSNGCCLEYAWAKAHGVIALEIFENGIIKRIQKERKNEMSEYIPDHPTIANLERTGDPYGRATVEPICPVCKKPCDTIYDGPNGTVGCDNCIHTRDAWEVPECLERE